MGHKILVSGRVQGVFFRAFTKKTAEEFGINGTVRNLDDGRVEIVCDSSPRFPEFLDKIKGAVWPKKVESVEAEEVKDKRFREFKVIY